MRENSNFHEYSFSERPTTLNGCYFESSSSCSNRLLHPLSYRNYEINCQLSKEIFGKNGEKSSGEWTYYDSISKVNEVQMTFFYQWGVTVKTIGKRLSENQFIYLHFIRLLLFLVYQDILYYGPRWSYLAKYLLLVQAYIVSRRFM